MQPGERERRIRSAVKDGWTRFVGATRESRGFHLPGRRVRKGKNRLARLSWLKLKVDPVELTVLVLNTLGPAMARANTTGKRVVVSVPDARLGEIFRSALSRSQSTRATDRLIEIVVDPMEDEDRLPAGTKRH